MTSLIAIGAGIAALTGIGAGIGIGLAYKLDKRHYYKPSENIAKKSETEGSWTNEDLHNIHREHNRYWIQKALKKSFQTLFMDAAVFNEEHAHCCKCQRNIQVLCRRLYAKDT